MGSGRERGGARAGADKRDSPIRHRGRTREAGLAGPTGLKWVFLFLGNF
jgi:hypothetical protein